MKVQKKIKQSYGMVDVSTKDVTRRVAKASATLRMPPRCFALFLKQGSPKGDVLETAKVAAVIAAKSTPSIIPLCHPLELGKVKADFVVDKKRHTLTAVIEVVYVGKTGVEMEALTAAAAAVLTVYDMMKWADKGMVISELKLLHKSGGKSGVFNRPVRGS